MTRDMDRISAQFVHPQRLLDEGGAVTVTRGTRGPRRLLCWATGGHDWTQWSAGASGWPARRCVNCGTRQVRLDASW